MKLKVKIAFNVIFTCQKYFQNSLQSFWNIYLDIVFRKANSSFTFNVVSTCKKSRKQFLILLSNGCKIKHLIVKLFDYSSKLFLVKITTGQSQRGFHLPKIFSKARILFSNALLSLNMKILLSSNTMYRKFAKNTLKNNCREFQIMKYICIPCRIKLFNHLWKKIPSLHIRILS